MKILILSGSRNREGQTARAIKAIRKGITAAKGKSEVIFLTELKLERCRQCDPDGWGLCRKEGRCVIEDDFASIVEKVKAADVLVFANPVYFGDLSESMRAFTRPLPPDALYEAGFRSSRSFPACGRHAGYRLMLCRGQRQRHGILRRQPGTRPADLRL